MINQNKFEKSEIFVSNIIIQKRYYSPDGSMERESKEGPVMFLLSKPKESTSAVLFRANRTIRPIAS